MSNALLIIDMQNYFLKKPFIKRDMDWLCKNINELILRFERNDFPVFHVLTVHKADKSTWDLKMLKNDRRVLIEGTEEAKEHSGIIFSPSHKTIIKTRLSAFIRTGLEEQLRGLGVDTVTVCGAYTHGCVGRTAIDAKELDFNVIIARQAIFSHRKELARNMLKQLAESFDASLLSNDEICGIISRGSRNEISVVKVAPGLYLSGRLRLERDLPALADMGIGAILDLTDDADRVLPETAVYLHIPLKDGVHVPACRLHEIYAFMDENIAKDGVLVCCSAGVSRSPGIVLGYLMLKNAGWTWGRALGHLNLRRFVWPALEIKESIIAYTTAHRRKAKKAGAKSPEIHPDDAALLRELEGQVGGCLSETVAIGWDTRGYVIKNGRVSGLGLYKSGLREIPGAVFGFSFLTDLFLYENHITDIPGEIKNLRRLKRVGLARNELSRLPCEIGILRELVFLNAGRNRIGTIHESLGRLGNLEELYLNNNEIDETPTGLFRIKRLTGLYLGHNRLTGLPREAGRLVGLKRLGLENNRIASIPESVVQMRGMKAINLHGNMLPVLPEGFGQLKGLDNLNLGGNALTGLPCSITRLVSLRRLNIGMNKDLLLTESQNEWIEGLRNRGCSVITDID